MRDPHPGHDGGQGWSLGPQLDQAGLLLLGGFSRARCGAFPAARRQGPGLPEHTTTLLDPAGPAASSSCSSLSLGALPRASALTRAWAGHSGAHADRETRAVTQDRAPWLPLFPPLCPAVRRGGARSSSALLPPGGVLPVRTLTPLPAQHLACEGASARVGPGTWALSARRLAREPAGRRRP